MAKIGRKTKVEDALLKSRVIKIMDWILAGISTQKIFQMISEGDDSWGLTERTFWNYVQRANIMFGEAAETHRDQEFGKALRRLNLLFASCYKIQDYKACLAVQKELNELLGLKAPTEHNLNHKVEKRSKEDIFKKMNEIKQRISKKTSAN